MKQLKILLVGIGYKASMNQEKRILTLNVGYSKAKQFRVPEEIEIRIRGSLEGKEEQIEGQCIRIEGNEWNKMMNFAQEIERIRKPEPYKGKGIHIQTEKKKKRIEMKRKDGKSQGKKKGN